MKSLHYKYFFMLQILKEKVDHLEHLVQLKDCKIVELNEQLSAIIQPRPFSQPHPLPLLSSPYTSQQPVTYTPSSSNQHPYTPSHYEGSLHSYKDNNPPYNY